jgi:hypothetical protein
MTRAKKIVDPCVSFYRMLTTFVDCNAEIDVFKDPLFERTHAYVPKSSSSLNWLLWKALKLLVFQVCERNIILIAGLLTT